MIPYYKKYIKLIKGPIKKAFKHGYKKEEVESKLKEKHWPQDVIQEAIKEVIEKPGISKKRLILTVLYWLGLATAASSFILPNYFLYLISIGVVLMLLSVPMKISDARKLKIAKEQQGKPGQLIPVIPAKTASPFIPAAKRESFFSRLFKRKPKELKKKEEKPEIPKLKEKEKILVEKRLVVKKQQEPKNPVLAMILSLIIPGLGQIYLGKTKRGLIILLTFWLIVPWIYGIIDAYQTAKEINKKIVPPSEIKKPEEKQKPKKKKYNLGTIILLFFSLAAFGLIYWLYSKSTFNIYNVYTYSTIVAILTVILLPIIRKSGKKEKKKEEGIPEKKVEMEDLRKEVAKKQEDYETDFDKLHKLVEKYGRIKIADVAETFKITKKEAEEWATILEQHNLASIYYPALGGPEIVRKKKAKKEEEEENA